MDANAADRVLLQSVKPALHVNVDCTALVAAVIHRQVPVVTLLLQVIFSLSDPLPVPILDYYNHLEFWIDPIFVKKKYINKKDCA